MERFGNPVRQICIAFDDGLPSGTARCMSETLPNQADANHPVPIVRLAASNPFIDGRQSDRAMVVRNGIERFFAERGCVTLPELALENGRRADVVALCPKGRVTIVEIKSSLADLRADGKWRDYIEWCDELYFATLADVPQDEFPGEAGLLIADAYGADIVREASDDALPAARRKKLHLRFARASALRLARCCAHAGITADDRTIVD